MNGNSAGDAQRRHEHHTPSQAELDAARHAFEQHEPRDLFYRAATELVELALREQTKLTVVEAIAVLLQTWNRSYYRFHGKPTLEHIQQIEAVVDQHSDVLREYRARTITNCAPDDEATVCAVFADMERVLGPVGAAKALHLLAPRLFPLWDRTIAAAYGLPLLSSGQNAPRYWAFLRIAQQQVVELTARGYADHNPLKALDEFNYTHYTNRWI
jgi:hypothetical protein